MSHCSSVSLRCLFLPPRLLYLSHATFVFSSKPGYIYSSGPSANAEIHAFIVSAYNVNESPMAATTPTKIDSNCAR